MSDKAEELRSRLSAAHAEALRVHDSPVRADRLAEGIVAIAESVETAELGEEQAARISAALADVLRVLRRDDDGREAARHLQTALSQLTGGSRRPSPFLDD